MGERRDRANGSWGDSMTIRHKLRSLLSKRVNVAFVHTAQEAAKVCAKTKYGLR